MIMIRLTWTSVILLHFEMRENVSNNISVKAMCLISLTSKDNLTKYKHTCTRVRWFSQNEKKGTVFWHLHYLKGW